MNNSKRDSLNEFEAHVDRFSQSELTKDQLIANFAMGLSGEAGEVTDLLKKHLFHGKKADRVQLISELGDVLWYWVALCQQFNIAPSEVMICNIEKLERRHEGKKFNREVSNKNKELEQPQ